MAPKLRRTRPNEGGYVLLTLLLMVSLLIVTFATILPAFTFELKRDQEEELIHRGVQYSRAIRAYYKKWGRYPTRLEDLENTNNLRYLRKRYKDPITHKDFKLLHYGEAKMSFAGGIGGGGIPGATPAGAMNGQNGSAFGGSGFGGSAGGSAFGGSSPGGSGFGGSGFGGGGANGPGMNNNGVNSNGVFSQSSGFGGSSNSGFGANSNSQSGQPGTNPTSSADSSQNATQGVSPIPGTSTAPGDASSASQQVIASGPIVGVASLSKKDSIREFNHKKKYNEWQFVYDPTTDRGGLLSTPNQPPLMQAGGLQPGQNGQPASGNPGSAFGSSGGFGSGGSGSSSFGSSGFGSSGFGNSNPVGGPGNPAQPPANPPSQ